MEAIVEGIGQKVRGGGRISLKEGLILAEFGELAFLGSLAHSVRQQKHPHRQVTYLIDRNINYTNVCNSDCSFCGFYRPDSSHPEAYVLSRESIGQKIEEALSIGATRILLQGGHNDDLPYSFYPELIEWITRRYPIELNAFSPSEIQQMKKVSGKSYREILIELKQAGLKGLPGGGGEILDDTIRRRVSPKKIKADEWINVMRVAQSLDLTTTATMVIGFGEQWEHRFNHLERIRNLNDESIAQGHEGFNSFIMWPLQHNENTSMGRSRHAAKYGASAVEYLRTLAVGRIFLDNVPHHQASWPTLGIDVAQIGLHFGADDIGSTMMEENVVSKAGALSAQCWAMSPEQLQQAIIDGGFEPAQRDTSFTIVRSDARPEPVLL